MKDMGDSPNSPQSGSSLFFPTRACVFVDCSLLRVGFKRDQEGNHRFMGFPVLTHMHIHTPWVFVKFRRTAKVKRVPSLTSDLEFQPHGSKGWFTILSNHRSLGKPDPFPWVSGGFREKEGSQARMGKVALEWSRVSAFSGAERPPVPGDLAQLHPELPQPLAPGPGGLCQAATLDLGFGPFFLYGGLMGSLPCLVVVETWGSRLPLSSG